MESLILVGGGLATGLIAYFLSKAGVRPLVIEPGPHLGGHHNGSLHEDDEISSDPSKGLLGRGPSERRILRKTLG